MPTTSPAAMPGEIQRLMDAIAGVYRGDRRAIELIVVAFLAGGHVLLEDIPGVGKTTLARALAGAIGGAFKRLQCTPDLMPSDISGISIYDDQDKKFRFHPGPLFCDVLLADELNRTPPRTQSALLEAMSEGQVTVEGAPMRLSDLFFCIATQNPVDHVGTYPLPDSQRDRFLLSFRLGYPKPEDELALLARDGAEDDLGRLQRVLTADSARALRARTRQCKIDDAVRAYLLAIVHATRGAKGLTAGASPRAAIGLQRACQARAVVQGRAYVIPEDVQALAAPALAHRVGARAGQNPLSLIQALVDVVAVPR